MLSRRKLLFGLLVLAVALIAWAGTSSQAQSQAQRGIAPTPTPRPPSVTLRADTSTVTICPEEVARVRLTAEARTSEGQPVTARTYRWRTTGGTIEGDGANVVWDLAGVRTGVYTATVEITTGNPGDECSAFTSVPIAVNECQPRVVCPNLIIYCPDTSAANTPVTFTVETSGGNPAVTPTFNWKVSAGTIASGQGTPSITVDTKGFEGRAITATVEVGGYSLSCTATCTTQIPPPTEQVSFDVYRDISYNNEKARLDNFVVWLQNHPGARGYILVYQGRRSRPGRAQMRGTRARDYLVNERGIEATRVEVLEGAKRDELTIELRGVPPGAARPTP